MKGQAPGGWFRGSCYFRCIDHMRTQSQGRGQAFGVSLRTMGWQGWVRHSLDLYGFQSQEGAGKEWTVPRTSRPQVQGERREKHIPGSRVTSFLLPWSLFTNP